MQLTVDYIIKNICADACFIKLTGPDGVERTVCKNKVGEFCDLTSHFVCELEIYKSRQQRHISVSSVGLFLRCPRFYQLAKIEHVAAPVGKAALWLGKEFHTCIGRIKKHLAWEVQAVPPTVDVEPHQRIVLEEVLRFCEAHRLEIPGGQHPEQALTTQLPSGRTLLARFDDLDSPDVTKTYIVEYKYAAMDYDHLAERRQLSCYFAACPAATHAKLVVFKKPDLRMTKADGGSFETFRLRARGEIAKRGMAGMVQVSEFSRKEFPIQTELVAMDAICDTIEKWTTDLAVWPGQYGMCHQFGGCEYLTYCKHH